MTINMPIYRLAISNPLIIIFMFFHYTFYHAINFCALLFAMLCTVPLAVMFPYVMQKWHVREKKTFMERSSDDWDCMIGKLPKCTQLLQEVRLVWDAFFARLVQIKAGAWCSWRALSNG